MSPTRSRRASTSSTSSTSNPAARRRRSSSRRARGRTARSPRARSWQLLGCLAARGPRSECEVSRTRLSVGSGLGLRLRLVVGCGLVIEHHVGHDLDRGLVSLVAEGRDADRLAYLPLDLVSHIGVFGEERARVLAPLPQLLTLVRE